MENHTRVIIDKEHEQIDKHSLPLGQTGMS